MANLAVLTESWYSLWTQHTLFYSIFFYPAMVAVYSAYLWRLEHLGHNWNLLLTVPVPAIDLFWAKLMVVAVMALLTQGYAFGLYLFCGRVFAHLPGLPPAQIILFLLRGWVGGLAVIAVQLICSMLIRSLAVPVFLALVGSVSALLAGSQGLSLLWPYCLMQAGMNVNRSDDLLADSYLPFFFSCLGWLAALSLLAALLLKKRDIHA